MIKEVNKMYSIVVDGDEVMRVDTYHGAVVKAKQLPFNKVIQVWFLGTYTCVARINKNKIGR
jgi:hypothetical protein